MLDKDFEDANSIKFDASMMKITAELKQATEGFEELRHMLPSIPVTDIPKLIEEMPLPYLTPKSKEMVQVLQSVGEEKFIDLALYEEYQKGASQVSLIAKYGVMRNRLYKVITGTSRPGGSQYQQGLKREPKAKVSESKVKQEALLAPSPTPRKGKGKSSKKK